MKRKDVIKLVNDELRKTDVEKPKFHSTHEGFGVLKEEFDELWDEIKTSKSFNFANRMMVNEAVQIAAMAIKFIENLYQAKHITLPSFHIQARAPTPGLNCTLSCSLPAKKIQGN